jgi:hypothetical protein
LISHPSIHFKPKSVMRSLTALLSAASLSKLIPARSWQTPL